MTAAQYIVHWYWRNEPDKTMYDVVPATNAERAINKVRKMYDEIYVMKRSDIVIESAQRYTGNL